MFPLSKLLSSAVTVCAMLSVFFQVIVVPADTVIVPGENAIPAMVTVFAELLELLLVLLLFEHDKDMIENSKNALPAVTILFFIFGILSYELK